MTLAMATFAASAQAPGDVRVALVIGNAAYPGKLALSNPANDAKAMAETLRSLGFKVVELRDGDQAQMTQAIAQVRDSLKGMQGIGMLYYAGHGLQLDWRNYMIPVDAHLNRAADVPAQTVDVNTVIEAFKQAGNRMNILVLDACRDNPFGTNGTASGKGLAQLDAPPGTFLAFATAPGNTAEDGDDSSGNGLYTQFLLQELKRPIAKIEDVFKRVRLNVRQKSQGRQIPWESTSLEDDFFFNDGSKTKPEDLDRQLAEARRKEQDLVKQVAQARERERQIALALERERQLQIQAARQAEEQRVAAENQAKEAERLAGEARVREQQRLAEQARQQAAQQSAEENRARERAQTLAAEQAKAQAQERALAQAKEAQARQQEALQQAVAEVKAKEEARRLSKEQQRDLAFAAEKAAWDKIKDSSNADDFYSYLKTYPNGLISQQATAALERLAAAKISPQADQNGMLQSAGPRFRVGDTFQFAIRNANTGLEKSRSDSVVTNIKDGIVEINNGSTLLTIDGAVIRNRYIANVDPPRLDQPGGDYSVGAKWTSRSVQTNPDGFKLIRDEEVKIVALEEVTVPAGTFKAYRLELNGRLSNGTQVNLTYWAQPGWGLPIKILREIRPRGGAGEREIIEMTSRKRGGA